MEIDEFRYAMSGNVAIAYAVYGEGTPDIVFVHGFAGNIEIERERQYAGAFHERISAFSRFVIFDRRGRRLLCALRRSDPSCAVRKGDRGSLAGTRPGSTRRTAHRRARAR